jgi:hypothetical protein
LSIPWELTFATAVLLEVQVTCDEMLDLLPSENVPVAVSCVAVPAAPWPGFGVIASAVNVTGAVVSTTGVKGVT